MLTMTLTMEAFLAELETEIDPNIDSLSNNPNYQSGTMEAVFEEQLATTLGNDFPYYSIFTTKDTATSEGGIGSNVVDQYISTPLVSDSSENFDNNGNSSADNVVSSDVQESQPFNSKSKEEMKKMGKKGGGKRKRQPNQVQDHIMAERRRRELLSHMFISLSSMIPGLKKVDKTTVLGAAIKHMKELQEKVKVLESLTSKQTVESIVVGKRSRIDFHNGSEDDNVSSSTVVYHCGSNSNSNDYDGDNRGDLFPEIEVKISEKTLLLKLHCKKHEDVITKVLAEVSKHNLTVINFSVIPFVNLALDITIVAKMESGFNKNVSDVLTTIRNVLRVTSCNRIDSNESK